MTKKIKITEDEFKEFANFFMLEKIATNSYQLDELIFRRMDYFKQLGEKYNFNHKKARLFSNGIIEIE